MTALILTRSVGAGVLPSRKALYQGGDTRKGARRGANKEGVRTSESPAVPIPIREMRNMMTKGEKKGVAQSEVELHWGGSFKKTLELGVEMPSKGGAL